MRMPAGGAEDLHRDMERAVGAGRAVGDRLGLGLRVRHEIGDSLPWALGRHRQHRRIGKHARHGPQLGHLVKRCTFQQARCGRQHGKRRQRHQQGVAIGAAFAAAALPMAPPAPARFSTTTVTPRLFCSASAIGRAARSACPPGGNGTMSVMLPLGQACAWVSLGIATTAGTRARPLSTVRRSRPRHARELPSSGFPLGVSSVCFWAEHRRAGGIRQRAGANLSRSCEETLRSSARCVLRTAAASPARPDESLHDPSHCRSRFAVRRARVGRRVPLPEAGHGRHRPLHVRSRARGPCCARAAPFALREQRAKAATVPMGFWRIGVVSGAAFFAGAILQQTGIITASVTNTGFLTALYVVITPSSPGPRRGWRPRHSSGLQLPSRPSARGSWAAERCRRSRRATASWRSRPSSGRHTS